MMTLFLLTTKSLGDYYVIAQNTVDAETILSNEFNRANYGYSDSREVIEFRVMAKEVGEWPEGKLNFSSGNRLIIQKPTT